MKERDKAKLFLSRAVSDEFHDDFKSIVSPNDRENITFTMLIELMKEHYTPNSNKVKNHDLFHRITQQSKETFDDFVYRVKAEAEHCNFKCKNKECTAKDILIRDQILVGTNHETIREDTLKNQWNLNDLLRKGRITESGILAVSQIKPEQTYDVNRGKAGVYSRKFSKKNKSSNQSSSFICWKCESEKCLGYNKCKYHQKQCKRSKKFGHSPESRLCKENQHDNHKHEHKHKRSNANRTVITSSEESDSSCDESFSLSSDKNKCNYV